MEWKIGDVLVAFADQEHARIRQWEYVKLARHRDEYLRDLLANTILSDQDLQVFGHIQDRVGNCASTIIWGTDEKGVPGRIIWGNFCENNFCPICSRKKSVRLGRTLNMMMDRLSDEGYTFLHLVLSDRNVLLSDLSHNINFLNESFKRFMSSLTYVDPVDGQRKKRFDGYFCSVEYTLRYNHGQVEVHPHFHVLLACSPLKKSYTYIPHADLVKIWRRSLKIDKRYPCLTLVGSDGSILESFHQGKPYDPHVFIYQVKKGDSSFLELTKYVFDFSTLQDFVKKHPNMVSLSTIYGSLRNVNVHRGGGVLRFSEKNLYFVQSTDTSSVPEYIPTYAIITGRSLCTYFYKPQFIVKFDDCVPVRIDDDIAPIKSFIKSYVSHQIYYFGYDCRFGDKVHLPDWWEDLDFWFTSNPFNSSVPIVPEGGSYSW